MAELSSVPEEVYDLVCDSLSRTDLDTIRMTSKHLDESTKRAPAYLRSEFTELSRRADHGWGEVPWPRWTLEIVKSPQVASYVQIVQYDHDRRDSGTFEDYVKKHELTERPDWQISTEDRELLEQAARQSHWMPEDMQVEFATAAKALEPDALITLILIHTPHLKKLQLPTYCWGGMCELPLMSAMLNHLHKDAKDDPSLYKSRPLAELEMVSGDIFNGQYGLDIESIAPVFALPSVRWVRTPWNHEAGFEWPGHLPQSHIEEMLLECGTQTLAEIETWAKEGIHGPCTIRQTAGYCRVSPTFDDMDWDTIVISADRDAEWEVTADDERCDSDRCHDHEPLEFETMDDRRKKLYVYDSGQ